LKFQDGGFRDVSLDPLSVRITQTFYTGKHCIKISAYSDKNCRRRSILKNCGQTDRQTEPQTDTSTDNK